MFVIGVKYVPDYVLEKARREPFLPIVIEEKIQTLQLQDLSEFFQKDSGYRDQEQIEHGYLRKGFRSVN